eukprot:scaffold149777_cov35-Attheya_sp.AAC.1
MGGVNWDGWEMKRMKMIVIRIIHRIKCLHQRPFCRICWHHCWRLQDVRHRESGPWAIQQSVNRRVLPINFWPWPPWWTVTLKAFAASSITPWPGCEDRICTLRAFFFYVTSTANRSNQIHAPASPIRI